MRNKIFPKRNVEPDTDILMSLFDNEIMSAILTGHLIIEALLVQLIQLKSKKGKRTIQNQNFPSKVRSCIELEYFDNKLGDYLIHINFIRNNYAHNLGYKITSNEVFLLAEKAGKAGIDFSDETIFRDKKTSFKCYSVTDIIQEIFQNTAMDLSTMMQEHGGTFIFT
jgi:ribosomal protein L30E